MAAPVGGDGGRQHARDRGQRAVEGELAERREALQRVGWNGADGGHDAERDRQVVVRALLRQVGRREVDDDAPAGRASPEAVRAARTRSFDSATALSGRPTSTKATAPEET